MTLGWSLQALVDDDVTTAQSEFWELGDGACSENGLRPGGGGGEKNKKKTLILCITCSSGLFSQLAVGCPGSSAKHGVGGTGR